ACESVPTDLAPPTVTTQPLSLTKAIGKTMTLIASVTGPGPFSYQWRLNGTNVLNVNDITGGRSNALTISGLEDGDAGDYSVVVSNAAGSVTTTVASLTVVPGDENQSPAISSISPSIGLTTGGTIITINGAGFRRDTAVTFGSAPASLLTYSSTNL